MKEIINKIGLKKIIIGITTFIVIILLLIGGALLYNRFFYKKSYTEIENIMTNAAKKYYERHKDNLPTKDGEIETIKVNKLVSSEYMKGINEYLKDDTKKCTGSINVTKLNTQYRYTPILDCGNDYKVTYLTNYIKENEKTVTEDNGLYELNNELVFKGENINNYINFANYSWRIVKISEEKTILIMDDFIKNENGTVWDDRYNEERKNRMGINNYEKSRAREYLETLYNDTELFNEEDKLLIANYNLYTGKRNITDEDKTGQAEKSKVLENQYIGLLPAYDYINASTDSNCKSLKTESCNNYNYLANYEKSWWLMTGNKDNTYDVYKSVSGGNLYSSKANAKSHIKPVIALVKDAIYISGNGTENDPYIIK